jgi:ERCC4-type nuclease
MELQVDYRERSVFESELADLSPTYVNLPAGDFAFIQNGITRIVFERKTLADLSASIVDGRYREQKTRCLAAVGGDPKCVGYIIEGRMDYAAGNADAVVRMGAMKTATFSMQHRDGFMLFVTDGVHETAALVRHLLAVAPAYIGVMTPTNYVETIKVNKASNCTVRNCMLTQLCVVPRVSASAADAIAQHFDVACIGDLVSALRDLGRSAAVKSIADVKGASGRRLGPALAQCLWDKFFGTT